MAALPQEEGAWGVRGGCCLEAPFLIGGVRDRPVCFASWGPDLGWGGTWRRGLWEVIRVR